MSDVERLQFGSTEPLEPRNCEICGREVPAKEVYSESQKRNLYFAQLCRCELDARKAQEENRENKQKNIAALDRADLIRRLQQRAFSWLGGEWNMPWLAHKTFKNFRTDEYQDQIEAIFSFLERKSGTLVLYGPSGVGKTHLLAALCNAFHAEELETRMVFVPSFFEAIQDRMSTGQSHRDIMQKMKFAKLAVFDDTDKAKQTEFREDQYISIINYRVENNLPIALSTNKEELLPLYLGEAAVDRLRIGQITVFIGGKSKRQ